MNRNPKESLKKIGILFFNFVLFYALFRLVVEFGKTIPWLYYAVTIVYAAAVVALFIAFFVLNGFTLNPVAYTREDLPDKWTEEKKTDFLRRLPENRAKAKKLIFFLLPLVLTLLISYIALVFFS